ncbi:peptidase domain-containing ABC transporter [Bordetella bronchialis]|uniref:peptidase domain-containing ABC transporter n=1 Tax=Bordetella bronchialis TaxID=463025 RepID=UPI003D057883
MIAEFYGHRVGLPELRRRYAISRKGSSLAGLVQIASQVRLASRAVRAELPSLGGLRMPCILHWEFNHFVVLERIKSGMAHIHDPAHGFVKVTMDAVSRKFTGVALEIWPAEGFEEVNENNGIRVSRLIGSLRGLRGTFLQLLVLSAALEVFVLAAPFYVQWTVDHAVPSADFDLMALLAVGFSALVICQSVTSLTRSWLLMHLGAVWNIRWRARIFSHLTQLPLDFFSKRHLGDLLSKVGAADEIQRSVTASYLEGTIDGLMTLLTLALLFLYSPRLAFIAFLSAVTYAVIRVSLLGPTRVAVQTHLIHVAKQQSHLLETLRGIRAIKLFSGEAVRQAAWLSLMADQINADVRVQRLTIVYKHSHALLSGFENILVVWLGACSVVEGNLTVGALMAFIAYKTLFQSRMGALIDRVAEYRMLSVQAERLSDIALAQTEEPARTSFSCDLAMGEADALQLEVSQLSFRYGDDEPLILENVTFTVYPGESLAITGASGSGKSTLAHLLLGVLTPTGGSVVLRSAARRHTDAGALRRAFGTVMQDDILLAGSLFENISFFDATADPEWVVACARMACIHDDINAMPMRYHTLVGDMGSALSGGQKQRILLARALYKRPAFLLLDEATSNLDIACERQVNAAVRALPMTRIIIAHRPETIASANRVLCLERGTIS